MGVDTLLWILAGSLLLLLIALAINIGASRLFGFSRADEIVVLFCGSKKSLANGVPMANILFPASAPGNGLEQIGKIVMQLLVPFVVGHLSRRWIGGWVEKHRSLIGKTDQTSILLVVYSAFSEAVVNGICVNVGPEIYTGFLYLCILPATVQSSIAFTSMAGGNVAAAVCAASASSLLGVFISPLLVNLVMNVHSAARGGFVDFFEYLTTAAIALLFFMHGAKLSREKIIAGSSHWRLHLWIMCSTFVIFPALGLLLVWWHPTQLA
ncbi:hypothetical protein CRX72_24210 [Pantoea sp. BRM17]|nr:hypothetical protein CRX72_24210 [Pantoea sp. BRM17]